MSQRASLLFLLFITAIKVSAQTGSTSNPNTGRENNPYSKYGIGELMNGNSAVLRGMGNITSAFQNPYEINSDNPASYSFIERTTFEIGGTGSTRNIVAPGLSYTTGTASLSYFTMAFPVNKNAGIAFGFKPISNVYYAMADTIPSSTLPSPIGRVIRAYNGEGGVNEAYLGGAWRYKGLSLGFNLGYMFGTMQHITGTIPFDSLATNRAYNATYANYTQLGGLHWKIGAMYERKLDSNYTIRLGGTFTLSQNILERFNSYQVSSFNFGDTIVNDTISNGGEQHGKLKLPMSFSLGAMLVRNDKWNIGVDYSFTQWSGFHSAPDADLNQGVGSQAYKLSLGGEYTPDINNTRNYFSRVTYRYGLYYGSDYINLSGSQLPVYGFTAGASLPVRRSLSHLHLALDLGRLGTTNNNLLQETYVRFTLGVSFNDRWFIKRKYD
jgi:long-subunit fatty acid transport protein